MPTMRLYFEALRAGHAGQALDIKGFDHLMKDAVDDVDGKGTERLEKAILACHFLKTAAPLALILRAVALGAGASDDEMGAITSYFEAIGVAFQIMVSACRLGSASRMSSDDIIPTGRCAEPPWFRKLVKGSRRGFDPGQDHIPNCESSCAVVFRRAPSSLGDPEDQTNGPENCQ